MNLVELQNKIHEQNKELGWWDESRPFSTFICLFHSELSEAVEGDRKGLMDDHLPQYPMVAVEVADFVIRVLDYLGSNEDIDIQQMVTIERPSYDACDFIAEMHQFVSVAHYFSFIDGALDQIEENLSTAVMVANAMSKKYEWDLLSIILEKVEYNKHRADHKRENRAKQGGKKY
ncbi:pyrophosphatase [Vibrio phage F89 g1]